MIVKSLRLLRSLSSLKGFADFPSCVSCVWFLGVAPNGVIPVGVSAVVVVSHAFSTKLVGSNQDPGWRVSPVHALVAVDALVLPATVVSAGVALGFAPDLDDLDLVILSPGITIIFLAGAAVLADYGRCFAGCKIECWAGRVDLLKAFWETESQALAGVRIVFVFYFKQIVLNSYSLASLVNSFVGVPFFDK